MNYSHLAAGTIVSTPTVAIGDDGRLKPGDSVRARFLGIDLSWDEPECGEFKPVVVAIVQYLDDHKVEARPLGDLTVIPGAEPDTEGLYTPELLASVIQTQREAHTLPDGGDILDRKYW